MNAASTPRESLLRSAASHSVDESLFVPLCYFDYFKNRDDYAGLLDDTSPFTEERSIPELNYRVDFYRQAGAVFMDWITTQGFEIVTDPSVKITEKSIDSKIINSYETPIGDLIEVYTRDSSAKTSFLSEPLLKTAQDATVYKYLVEAQSIVSAEFGEGDWLEAIGGSGIACQVSGSAPYHEVLHRYRPEDVLVAGLDLPREIEELIDAIHRRNIGIARHLANSSFSVIKFESLWDVGVLSPPLLSRYYAPHLAEYCDILHAAGKITMDHVSGQEIGSMIDHIEQCGIDFLYGVEVRIDNAKDLLELTKKLEGAMILCLGISPVDLWRLDLPELVENWVKIADTFASQGAVFGTADAVVPGTDPAKLKTASDVLCRRGISGS